LSSVVFPVPGRPTISRFPPLAATCSSHVRQMLVQVDEGAHEVVVGHHPAVFPQRIGHLAAAVLLQDQEPDQLGQPGLQQLPAGDLQDLRDIVAILHHHDVSDQDGDTVHGGRVAALCAGDWGLWRTTKMNVERVREGLGHYDLSAGERAVIEERLGWLWERIEAEPKSRGWRMRDRIGDRKRWYEEPEEVG